jgi:hypothetical protein
VDKLDKTPCNIILKQIYSNDYNDLTIRLWGVSAYFIDHMSEVVRSDDSENCILTILGFCLLGFKIMEKINNLLC